MNARPLAIVDGQGRLVPLDANGYPLTPAPAAADPTTLVLAEVATSLRESAAGMIGVRDVLLDLTIDRNGGARLHFRAIA
jgi:hypothetical protein